MYMYKICCYLDLYKFIAELVLKKGGFGLSQHLSLDNVAMDSQACPSIMKIN